MRESDEIKDRIVGDPDATEPIDLFSPENKRLIELLIRGMNVSSRIFSDNLSPNMGDTESNKAPVLVEGQIIDSKYVLGSDEENQERDPGIKIRIKDVSQQTEGRVLAVIEEKSRSRFTKGELIFLQNHAGTWVMRELLNREGQRWWTIVVRKDKLGEGKLSFQHYR